MPDVDAATVRSDARQWHGLVVTGAWCAFAGVAMMLMQIGTYAVWPPPDSTAGFFELLLDNPVLGLVSLDLPYIVSNTLMYLVYLALAVVLWQGGQQAPRTSRPCATPSPAARMCFRQDRRSLRP